MDPISQPGLLRDLLPGKEERRWTSPNPRSEETQQVPKDFTFPCAEHSGRSSYRGQGGMVHVRRLEGRLLSCAYCASSQAVSSLCLQRSSFPVQGAPIWTLPLLDD